MNRVTPRSFGDLLDWYGKAISHPDVSRFLAAEKYVEFPKLESFESDYARAGYLSESGLTYLRIGFDRDESGNIVIALWSLADEMRRKVECGRALIFLRDVVLKTYWPRTASCCVHGTNVQSLKLMRHIFGEPWGIHPVSGWDRGRGAWVDMHHFQMVV